ncbi:MAG: S9 family peptidase, partial [bacterium]
MAFALIGGIGAATAQTKNITLEDIWTKGSFRPQGVYGIRSMQDGEHYCTMSRTGIAKYSYATGEKVEDVCLFDKDMPRMESYEFSADESKILLSSGLEPLYRHSGVSDYWLYDIQNKTFTQLTKQGKQRLTTLSPDGTKTAYVRDNNLYWMDLATLRQHQITSDGKVNEIIYGTTDWVYEEEFAITKGFQWSPDSKRIAYYRFDESKVKEYNMQMWGALYPEDYRYKYPKAGEDNSKVQLRVYDLESGKNMFLPALTANSTSEGGWEYIPRFQWTNNPNVLAFMCMNRLQNTMNIITLNVLDGEKAYILYEEQNDTYVEVPDTWKFVKVKNEKQETKGKRKKAVSNPPQPAESELLLITSEKNGYRHIYLYDMQGDEVQQVTSGDWEVCEVVGVDTKNQRLYYTSREHHPTQKSLFVIGFDGKNKQCLNDMTHNVMNTGDRYVVGTYNATFSNGCKYYIRTFSTANEPPVYTLHDANGKLIKVLEDNGELHKKMMVEYGPFRKRFKSFTTSAGVKLNYYTITPKDFDLNKKYPVLIYVYGGPGNQQVTDSYGYSDFFWYHMLAEKGYVVFCFDGRGTGGRGAAFKKQTYGDLGRMECEDAIEAARWLGQQT